jgi:uncharacterized protein YecE (DUF72 family)
LEKQQKIYLFLNETANCKKYETVMKLQKEIEKSTSKKSLFKLDDRE